MAAQASSQIEVQVMQEVMQTMQKAPDSQCVVNIVPPRALLGAAQQVRTQHISEARCVLHSSAIDPFVRFEDYPAAALVLHDALRGLQAFKVVVDTVSFFEHSKKSYSLYMAPSDARTLQQLDELHDCLFKAFPQCDDLRRRSKTGKVVFHMTLAKARSRKEAEALQSELQQTCVPFVFDLREVYMLHRTGSSPFEVYAAVPLGGGVSIPHYGPNSVDDAQDTRVGRTIVIYNTEHTLEAKTVVQVVSTVPGVQPPVAYEQITNPAKRAGGARSARSIVVVEMATLADAQAVLAATRPTVHIGARPEQQVAWPWPGTVVRPLAWMVFPNVVGGSCSAA
jgi:2'-5' RNA ligase